jgi:type II secretory pathway pseudopilin PulG
MNELKHNSLLADPTGNRCTRFQRCARGGVTIVEVMVAAALVCVIASLVSAISVAGQRAAMQVRHLRLASDEANNQLQRLVSGPIIDVSQRCESVQPSDELLSVFPKATVRAAVNENDELRWVSVVVNWGNRPHESVELAAPIHFAALAVADGPDGEAALATEPDATTEEKSDEN